MGKARARLRPVDGEKMTLAELERELRNMADILRGKIDSADYKKYILALFFYKRLCDVWAEEHTRLVDYGEANRDGDRAKHRFHIPKGAAWRDVRQHRTGLGLALNRAFRALEEANHRLQGIFQDVDFNNKERFPDSTLEFLLGQFERISLRNCDVETDVLGNAYEYLIAQFADDAGKKGGEFYTPKHVVRLLIECLEPAEGMSIYDPTCGSGGMLLEAVQHLKLKGKDARSLKLYGQEMNLDTWAICQMNLFLHDVDDARIARGDTLRDPKHLDGDRLQTFDRVLANPPFSLRKWGHEVWKKGDRFDRKLYGCPPQGCGDLAFVQHMVASLEPRGRLGVVVPHGVLFRRGSERRIRQGLVEDDLIEAVIALAPNLFYGTAIPACVLLIHKDKPRSRQGKVLFINGVDEARGGKNKNYLSDANVERLASTFHAYQDVEGFARVVLDAEIEKNSFDLTVTRYMQPAEADEEIDIRREVLYLQELRVKRDKAEKRVERLLRSLGHDS